MWLLITSTGLASARDLQSTVRDFEGVEFSPDDTLAYFDPGINLVIRQYRCLEFSEATII
jgi:hypothetical protein